MCFMFNLHEQIEAGCRHYYGLIHSKRSTCNDIASMLEAPSLHLILNGVLLNDLTLLLFKM